MYNESRVKHDPAGLSWHRHTTETPKNDDAADASRFMEKHEQELGFKRFATIQGLYLIVPMVAMAMGGVVGYFTLGKPLSKMFPKLSSFAGGAEGIIRNGKNISRETAEQAAQLFSAGKKPGEIMHELGIEVAEVPKIAKLAGAAALGFVTSLFGSVAVGYDKWRKDESARLAAEEINSDISKLQLFKPSDPELVSENKRLRAMLAEAPQAIVNEVQHQGRAKPPRRATGSRGISVVEIYSTKPLKDRPSQQVGFGDYIQKGLTWGLLPMVAAIGAVLIGKFTKQRFMPLDGSPDIFTKAYDQIIKRGVHSATGHKVVINEVERLSFITHFFSDPETKKTVTKHFWNGVKGLEFGTIPVVFHVWRQQEKQRIDLTSTYAALKEIDALKPTDAELVTENVSLRQQVAYVKNHAETPRTQLAASQVEHHGAVAERKEIAAQH